MSSPTWLMRPLEKEIRFIWAGDWTLESMFVYSPWQYIPLLSVDFRLQNSALLEFLHWFSESERHSILDFKVLITIPNPHLFSSGVWNVDDSSKTVVACHSTCQFCLSARLAIFSWSTWSFIFRLHARPSSHYTVILETLQGPVSMVWQMPLSCV